MISLPPRTLLLVAVLATGCGSWGRVGDQPEPSQAETLTQILDLNSVYRRLGRLTGQGEVPFIASVAFFGGAGDSTVAVVGLSLESRNLLFQRDGDGFRARYRVEIIATPVGGGAVVRSTKEQSVRVARFAETQRNDESVLYQEGLTLNPGQWRIAVQVSDLGGDKTSRAEAEFKAPTFGRGTFTAPALAYQVRGRGERTAAVAIILNPRGALAYGGDTAIAYVEAYDLAAATRVPITLIDSRDSVVLTDSLRFEGGRQVESSVLRFAPSTTSLGELRIVAGSGENATSTTALVSFSTGWVITNFDEMVSLLRFFPPSVALDSLRKARESDRARLWQVFFRQTDPNTATPAHELLDRYFGRLAYANQRFRDEGTQGWRTDRGEVLIRMGEPDEVFDASPTSEGRLIRWGYTRYNLTLYFVDESGFGRFKLVPTSRSALENVAGRELP